MKIILGLGNPGPQYASHRHTIGFRCIDRLARRLATRLGKSHADVKQASGQLLGAPVVLAQALTFMNRSGRAAARLLREHDVPVTDLIVVHDEVELDLGTVRVKSGGGHGGHNGLRSIIQQLGERDFTRIRMGVGRPPSDRIDLADWVLSDFERDEREQAERMSEEAADAVEAVVVDGVEAAMNRFNARST